MLPRAQPREDERLKALAGTKAACVIGCEFCLDIGSHISREAGVTEEQLRTLHAYRDSPAFSPLERLVMEYAEEMCQMPASISDELFARMREHFDRRADRRVDDGDRDRELPRALQQRARHHARGLLRGRVLRGARGGCGSGGGAHVRVAGRRRLERGGEAAPALGERRAVSASGSRTGRTPPALSRLTSAPPRRRLEQRERPAGLGLELERRRLEVVVERVGVDAVERRRAAGPARRLARRRAAC